MSNVVPLPEQEGTSEALARVMAQQAGHGNIIKVPTHLLYVDEAVQRDRQETHIAKIAAEWNARSCGTLIGSLRADGRVMILDGYQRLSALKSVGAFDYMLPVEVHENLTLKEEAEIFLRTNRNRKNVSPYQKFKVALVAEDPTALAVNEVVTDLGFRVGPKSTPDMIGCVATLERIVGRKGVSIEEQQEVLRWTLSTYDAVWGYEFGADHWRGEVVEGLAQFYMAHKDDANWSATTNRAVIVALRKMTISQLLTAAKVTAVGNNRASGAVARIILDAYNKGKKRKLGEDS